MVSSSQPNLLENAISRLPRMRAWMFSSVASSAIPAKWLLNACSIEPWTASMGMVRSWMPRVTANCSASSRLCVELWREGMAKPWTRS